MSEVICANYGKLGNVKDKNKIDECMLKGAQR